MRLSLDKPEKIWNRMSWKERAIAVATVRIQRCDEEKIRQDADKETLQLLMNGKKKDFEKIYSALLYYFSLYETTLSPDELKQLFNSVGEDFNAE